MDTLIWDFPLLKINVKINFCGVSHEVMKYGIKLGAHWSQ